MKKNLRANISLGQAKVRLLSMWKRQDFSFGPYLIQSRVETQL